MGIFSSIKKAFKKVWSGIKKVFKGIMKPIAKFLNSKVGKILMMGVAVFTMGSALLAGGKGFMAGQGFLGKFINGGKEFLNTLIGTNFQTTGNVAEGAAGAAGAANAATVTENAGAAADLLTGAETAGGVAEGVASVASDAAGAPVFNAGGATQQAGAAAAGAGAGAGAGATQASGGWLAKAASAAMDFAKSDTGKTVIGNMISGAGAGSMAREQQRFDSRVERMFEDPNDPGVKALADHDFNVDAPAGMAGDSARYAQRINANSGRYTPRVPYGRLPAGG